MNPSKRRQATKVRAALTVLAVLATSMAGAPGCGVQEHLHDQQALLDHSSDFGPSTTGVGGSMPPPITMVPSGGAGGVAGTIPAPAVGGMGGSAPAAGAGSGASSGASGAAASGSGASGAGAGAAAAGAAGSAAAGSGGTAAPSGVTVDLGGMQIAKEDAIAFIHFGHSNMAGRATGPTGTRPYFFDQTDPHAWMYHVGKPPELAKEPFTAGDDLSGRYGGPGTALIKQAAAAAPDKHFISLGFAKSSAYCSQFLPGSLYYDSVMEDAMAIKDRVTFAAIVIMLGITERHGTSADITGYSSCINKLVTAVRTDVGRPDLPLLITDYEVETTGTLRVSSSFAQSIIPEIRKIPSVVSNSALVPTDGLSMEDDHHFDLDGHKVWTGRVIQIMKDKGWFPWAK